MPPVTQLLCRGKSPEELLELLFTSIPFDIIEKRALAFQCSCSRKKVERALIPLGREEIAAIIAGEEKIDVTCEFCHESYVFSREELEQLMRQMQ